MRIEFAGPSVPRRVIDRVGLFIEDVVGEVGHRDLDAPQERIIIRQGIEIDVTDRRPDQAVRRRLGGRLQVDIRNGAKTGDDVGVQQNSPR